MKLPKAFNGTEATVNVIIETPRGSRNKFNYDEKTSLFRLGKVLPAGLMFPHHFGFIPHTKGGDGDPLDVLVMMDIPAYPGNLIECRLIGVIEAEQIENEEVYRNDRLVAVPVESRDEAHIHSIKDIEKNMVKEIISFFQYYNSQIGKEFKVLKVGGPSQAINIVKTSMDDESNESPQKVRV